MLVHQKRWKYGYLQDQYFAYFPREGSGRLIAALLSHGSEDSGNLALFQAGFIIAP